jgi:glycine cleavage system aminomethyltransferase T
MGSTLNYHILSDSAAAAYLWDRLADVMDEFNGKPVGLMAMRRLDPQQP